MIMAAIYLFYSAYFLSVDFASIYDLMSIAIAVIYVGVGFIFTRSNIQNKKKVRLYMDVL